MQRDLETFDFEKIRREITALVCNQACDAVDQMLEHIKAGNVQAMKYLFEMVGLFPAATIPSAEADDSLTRRLLIIWSPRRKVLRQRCQVSCPAKASAPIQ